MNIAKKDQSRTEVMLIIGFILLALLALVRFFGPYIYNVFFGAGQRVQTVDTDAEQKKQKQADKDAEQITDEIDINRVDPKLYGNEEAIAQLYYQKEQEKKERVKALFGKITAWLALIIVLGLIGWKTFTIIREIKVKNISDIEGED